MRNTTINAKYQKPASLTGQSGFTLIEVAIVTVIVGLILAAAMQLLSQRQEWVRQNNTRATINILNNAISGFRDAYGRYPCPASLSAAKGSPEYGVESDSAGNLYAGTGSGLGCYDTASVAVDTGIDAVRGYARVTANPARTITYFDKTIDPGTGDPIGDIGPVTPVVRIGTIPFKNLNLEETDLLDGYGNRILYAVTEQMAVSETYENADGGIDIINDQNASIVAPDSSSAHFIVLSMGKNGAGAYTYGGARLPCPAGNQEADNCDFDNNATFRVAQTSTNINGDASTYDDVMSYATQNDAPLWERGPDGSDDIKMKSIGRFGVGPTASKTPQEEVQIEGEVIARDDPATPDIQEGKVETNVICDYASGSTSCFPSSLIAGQIALGGGMKCPTGQFMTGIRNNAPVCEDEIRVTCPAGHFVVGVDADGGLLCDVAPPAPCQTTDVLLCSQSETLFAASHNQYKTISVEPSGNPGGTRYRKYRCENGTWKHVNTWGDPCECTPGFKNPYTTLCASGSICGHRYTGIKTDQKQKICPSGEEITVTLNSEGCIPIPSSDTKDFNCPHGFNTGKITKRSTHDIITRTCSAWAEEENTCQCTPNISYREKPCTGDGMVGSISQERGFFCPNGPDSPGERQGWHNVGNQPDSTFCSCENSSYEEDRDCPIDGEVGDYRVRVDFDCTTNAYTETPIEDTCRPAGQISCTWQSDSNQTTLRRFPAEFALGDSCDCGDTGSCSDNSSAPDFIHKGTCTCR